MWKQNNKKKFKKNDLRELAAKKISEFSSTNEDSFIKKIEKNNNNNNTILDEQRKKRSRNSK